MLQLDTRTLDNPEVCMTAAVPVSGVTVAGPELPSLLAHCSARGWKLSWLTPGEGGEEETGAGTQSQQPQLFLTPAPGCRQGTLDNGCPLLRCTAQPSTPANKGVNLQNEIFGEGTYWCILLVEGAYLHFHSFTLKKILTLHLKCGYVSTNVIINGQFLGSLLTPPPVSKVFALKHPNLSGETQLL